MTILINVLLAIWVLVALLMVLVILMQRPKSEGLGAAFGAGVTENIFGAQTTNVLVKFTGWLAGFFFLLTFALSILYAHKNAGNSALRRELLKQQTAAQPSPGATAAQPSPAAAANASPASSTAPAQSGSPPASPAPDSGAGVLPPGNTTPAGSPAATTKP
ncbi:MAG TPA: preprotein translocase subunit SecG [Chthoniobacterales bacterium]